MDQKTTPIVVDLGKRPKKKLVALERGEGELANEIAEALKEIRASLGAQADEKLLLPVVVIYKEKRKAKGWLGR